MCAKNLGEILTPGFSEENQQVAMKRDEPTSLLYSHFIRSSSRFAAITVTFP
jgi:hypothetical protein